MIETVLRILLAASLMIGSAHLPLASARALFEGRAIAATVATVPAPGVAARA